MAQPLSDAATRWTERYATDDYLYGVEPNDFLRSQLDDLTASPNATALCYADGEGRNSVYVAERGWATTAVDLTEPGIAKGQRLAAERGVNVTGIVADLTDWDLGIDRWDLIVSIFAHMPPTLRADLHRRVVAALKPGGLFVLEAYTPDQIGRGTGGPPVAELTMTPEALRSELVGLEIDFLSAHERSVIEGAGHSGDAAVVQLRAHKPAE